LVSVSLEQDITHVVVLSAEYVDALALSVHWQVAFVVTGLGNKPTLVGDGERVIVKISSGAQGCRTGHTQNLRSAVLMSPRQA
jgi:hypothetical protein